MFYFMVPTVLIIEAVLYNLFSGDRHATCSYELIDLFLGLFCLLFVSFTYCRHCLEGKISLSFPSQPIIIILAQNYVGCSTSATSSYE